MAEELQEELEVLAEIYEGLKVTQESEGVSGDFEVQTGSVLWSCVMVVRSFYHQPPNRRILRIAVPISPYLIRPVCVFEV